MSLEEPGLLALYGLGLATLPLIEFAVWRTVHLFGREIIASKGSSKKKGKKNPNGNGKSTKSQRPITVHVHVHENEAEKSS
jgi:hypothetical protein